jgi:hypothetical protein
MNPGDSLKTTNPSARPGLVLYCHARPHYLKPTATITAAGVIAGSIPVLN